MRVSDHISPPPLLDLSWRKGSFILNLPSHHSTTSSARASSVGRHGDAELLGGHLIDASLDFRDLLHRQSDRLFDHAKEANGLLSPRYHLREFRAAIVYVALVPNLLKPFSCV